MGLLDNFQHLACKQFQHGIEILAFTLIKQISCTLLEITCLCVKEIAECSYIDK